MQADASTVKIRSSYNLAAMSFTPKEITEEIKKHYPNFTVDCALDFKQKIANSWPASINDSLARAHWGCENDYNIENMTDEMFNMLKENIY